MSHRIQALLSVAARFSALALAVGLYSTFYYIGGSAGGALPSLVWVRGGWPACVALIVSMQMAGVAIAWLCWGRTRAHAKLLDPVV